METIIQDTIGQLRELALASRLKRLSDTFMRDVSAVYQQYHLDFDATWFPVFHLLSQRAPQSVTEIAEALGVTHPAVIYIVRQLGQHGLAASEKSSKDSRKRMVRLTKKGENLIPQLQPLWQAFIEVNQQLLSQQQHNLLFALEEMEAMLVTKTHFTRVMEHLKSKQQEQVEILDFEPRYRAFFKNLNLAWIEKYFQVEEPDLKTLEHPEEYILSKGGYIFFARYQGEIVGTCALLRQEEAVFELSKMTVSEQHQGKQIGKKLCIHAVEKARQAGAKQVYLETNSRLLPAIALYQKVGFRKVAMGHSPYQRADVKMVIDF